VLVVAKTYPNLSRKYDRTVCTAGIDLDTNEWIRIFPIRFFDLPYSQRFKKYDVIEIEVEQTNDKYMRKESHHAKDSSIRIVENIGTQDNWAKRKEILFPLISNSIEDLKEKYNANHTSMGIIKPKKIIDFESTPIERCRDWEQDLVLGIQQTLDCMGYKSPLDKIPYKFSYVFNCNESSCKTHDLMIEDWEICQLYRSEKQNLGEKESLAKVAQKYRDQFINMKDIHFIVGTESNWNNWLIISVFYPKKSC
jgi:hypothetical protein